MKTMGFSVKKLGKIDVYDESKDSVRISDLWKETTAVLVFVRHFG